MQDESITEILSKTEIAHGLGRADLNLVLAHSQVKTANPGEVVIAEGDPGHLSVVSCHQYEKCPRQKFGAIGNRRLASSASRGESLSRTIDQYSNGNRYY